MRVQRRFRCPTFLTVCCGWQPHFGAAFRQRVILKLPQNQRECLLLYFYFSLSSSEEFAAAPTTCSNWRWVFPLQQFGVYCVKHKLLVFISCHKAFPIRWTPHSCSCASPQLLSLVLFHTTELLWPDWRNASSCVSTQTALSLSESIQREREGERNRERERNCGRFDKYYKTCKMDSVAPARAVVVNYCSREYFTVNSAMFQYVFLKLQSETFLASFQASSFFRNWSFSFDGATRLHAKVWLSVYHRWISFDWKVRIVSRIESFASFRPYDQSMGWPGAITTVTTPKSTTSKKRGY